MVRAMVMQQQSGVAHPGLPPFVAASQDETQLRVALKVLKNLHSQLIPGYDSVCLISCNDGKAHSWVPHEWEGCD